MRVLVGIVVALVFGTAIVPPAAQAAAYDPITGSGSTWSQNAFDQWRRNVASNLGMTVNYNGTGSAAGRRDFIQNTVDFAISEIPFQSAPEDGSAPETPLTPYAYLPIVAGGTAFMYNLRTNGQLVTDLHLSGETVARIFTGGITTWNDPAIVADNPGLTMPDRQITLVVRSDGSGSTAHFTSWLASEHPTIWNSFCAAVGRQTPCGATSQYPTFGNAKAQNGSLGVSGYVKQNYGEGAITYVEYSYALNAGFPVAKVLNAAGQFVAPEAPNVTASLRDVAMAADGSIDPVGGYRSSAPNAYPLSGASYAIVPTQVAPGGAFTVGKGTTLATFLRYAMCEGQQQMMSLGYAPLPRNLVIAASNQIARIPGSGASGVDLARCNNPAIAETPPNPVEVGLSATVLAPGTPTLTLQFPTQPARVDAPHTENGLSVTTGRLPAFGVVDSRSTGRWSIVATATDFALTSNSQITIDRRWLGLAPVVPNNAAITAGPILQPGTATYPTVLASSDATGVDGSVSADFRLVAPPTAPGGIYRSTVSITLVAD